MSKINRPKQPEVLRAKILKATQDVLLSEGLAALTQEKVLAQLDISKGGLQHHFRTKQDLLDALFDHVYEGFEELYNDALAQEPEGPARHIRAYVIAASRSGSEEKLWGQTLVLLAVGNANYQARWQRSLEDIAKADSLDPGKQLACRLFADGLWYSLVIGPDHHMDHVQSALQHILSLTE
ncbi:TetR/AcrR family transcriptional regulator [Alcaligenaceae bacterium 429]|uniref:TetR/AcrR family transcriptional regulator n=1 Tax=Paenalcaligenes sp. Me52 TaxID=3392038 RepID=UPI001092213E|nr:TetR/AcrR family transcriptional regulator [Alcaligenaceae bacterium 429]